MTKNFNKKYIRFSLINAFVAFLLFLLVQKNYFLPGNDSKVFFYGPILKNKVFRKSNNTNTKDYIFINTNFDNYLVENYDSEGFPNGNINIVDREKLFHLFKKIEKQPSYKYIICDILFENKSPYDDSLSSVLKKTKNIIIPRKHDLLKTIEPFRKINSGLVDIYTTGGTFYKYKLLDDSNGLRSIPLKIYEELNNTSISTYYLFSTLNTNLVFNDFIPEHRLNSYNVLENNNYTLLNLGDVLNISDSSLKKFIDNRIVVIGNYNTDMKNTIYGNIPGPLLLTNAFLALENQENKISFFLIISLLVIFFIFSYVVISPQDKVETRLLKIPIIGGLLVGTGYLLMMSIFTLIIYLIFSVNINLSYIALFFYIENLIINKSFYFQKLKEKLVVK